MGGHTGPAVSVLVKFCGTELMRNAFPVRFESFKNDRMKDNSQPNVLAAG